MHSSCMHKSWMSSPTWNEVTWVRKLSSHNPNLSVVFISYFRSQIFLFFFFSFRTTLYLSFLFKTLNLTRFFYHFILNQKLISNKKVVFVILCNYESHFDIRILKFWLKNVLKRIHQASFLLLIVKKNNYFIIRFFFFSSITSEGMEIWTFDFKRDSTCSLSLNYSHFGFKNIKQIVIFCMSYYNYVT